MPFPAPALSPSPPCDTPVPAALPSAGEIGFAQLVSTLQAPEPLAVPPDVARHHALLARMLVVLRLVAPDGAEPAPASRDLVARASGTGGWEELLAAHEAARQSIRSLWQEVAESRGC